MSENMENKTEDKKDLKAALAKLQKDLDALKEKAGGKEPESDDRPTPEGEEGEDKSGEKDENSDDGKDDKDAKDAKDAKGEKGKKGKTPKLTPAKKAMVAVALVLVLCVGVYFLMQRHKYESTDDAYVRAYSTQLGPEVSARVVAVLVDANQHVKAGQILAQLDKRDFVSAFEDAQASYGAVEAQFVNAERDYRRAESLVKNRVITRQQFDNAHATYVNFDRQAKAASAKVEQARLDLEHTSIRAPNDGQIAVRSVDVGQYVAGGTAIFGFVPNDTRWVDANFKETQLEYMKPGRPAEVTVDAIPGKKFAGVVESLSPSTGATFTLMPPDNATGNFTKVVQRVPVRIRLKNLTEKDYEMLQAGLSANVDLLKHEAIENIEGPAKPVFVADEIQQKHAGEQAKPAEAAQEDGPDL